MKKQEVEFTNKFKISCDGGYEFDHPLIYLHITREEKEVACPYCGKKFIYKENKNSE